MSLTMTIGDRRFLNNQHRHNLDGSSSSLPALFGSLEGGGDNLGGAYKSDLVPTDLARSGREDVGSGLAISDPREAVVI